MVSGLPLNACLSQGHTRADACAWSEGRGFLHRFRRCDAPPFNPTPNRNMLHPATIEALKPLRTALEAAQATTADLRAKLDAATQQVATADEGAELVQELERDRQRIVATAYIEGKAPDTKVIDKQHAAAIAARDKRKAEADAASAAMPMLIKLLDEAQDAERAAEVALHQVALEALRAAMDMHRDQLHELANQVIEVLATMAAVGQAADCISERLSGRGGYLAAGAWALARASELLTARSPNAMPVSLTDAVAQLAPGWTREVMSELRTHGIEPNGRRLAAPKPPETTEATGEPRSPQTFILGPNGERIPALQSFGQTFAVGTGA